jgi:hypothetical protein
LVPINTLMPLGSPSLSTLGSSSARYGLSFPLLGRSKVTLEDVFRQPDDEISKEGQSDFYFYFYLGSSASHIL